ncbi:MAG: hypothetical protein ACREGI_00335 [Candidatus Levyibacteriota bacterium]
MPTCPPHQVLTELGCIPDDPAGFAAKLYSIGLSIVGGLALLSILYGGYILLTSRGNREAVRKGKSYITYAIIGLLLAVFAVTFFSIITVDVLKIPGFSK